jgi:hypothetical protein
MNTQFRSRYLKETNHLGEQVLDGDRIKTDEKNFEKM